jgi:NAD(P)-dependent dehydrogenase (short-subunit alcohol dehydrogenase family)
VSEPALTAVVTGASSGIGRAFAERLAASGYRVWAFSRPSAHFDAAREAWAGLPISAMAGDVTSESDIASLAAAIAQGPGRLDLLVNNAGAYFAEDGGLPTPGTLQRNLDVNLLGPYQLILGCLGLLERGDRPMILNVSSGAGSLANTHGPGPLGYRVSKAALNMLTRSLAFELAPRGITMHAVDPGYIKTRLNPDGTGTPEQAVDGMWPLVSRHGPAEGGLFWHDGQVVPF